MDTTPLIKQLTKYAAYHRDPRNIATHYVGIPLIVFAVTCFLARPTFVVGSFTLAPVYFVAAAATAFYLRHDLRYGIVMGVVLAAMSYAALFIGALGTAAWLVTSIALFVGGWVIQFVGHYYEGKKPAFVDDLVGLIVGPLFVCAEVGFLLGLRNEVKHEIEKRVGAPKLRDMTASATTAK
ncbi:MAG: DUF962 domain-containing protein [Archangium sp.]